jgi:serine phosphatase RsbU (regulator of sigma subunit)
VNALDRTELSLVRRIPALSNASDAALSALIDLSPVIEFGVGECLMSQSQRSDFAMIILSGEVTAFNVTHQRTAPLAHLAAPTLVGEVGALLHGYRSATVVARTPVQALRIERETLLRICEHDPAILISIIGVLGHHMAAVNDALGLYAGGFAALEVGDLDPSILADLTEPPPQMRIFADAFRRMARQITRERRQRDELASAALIQRAMLPGDLSLLPLGGRCDAFGDMRAAREVGGDFYDAFMLDDDRLVVTIGDVCGKGVPAALFMSQTMTTLRMAARRQADVSAMLEDANDMLCADNPSLMFTTAFCGVLDLSTGRLEYANCGHCPPLLLREDGGCEPLPGGGTSLGLASGLRIVAREITLRPGEGVFLYTDGVTESADPVGVEYGEERLAAALSAGLALGSEGRARAVMDDVARFTEGAEPFDDITCLAAIFRAPSAS